MPMKTIHAAQAMLHLERLVAAVKGQEEQESRFAKALATLKTLSRKEGIPLAIVGGLAAIHHGYERFTKDIDVVVQSEHLLDPRWQRVRLRVFARDSWTCVVCGDLSRTLHVHHLSYERGREPWESPPDALATLCELCHLLLSPVPKARPMAELGMTVE